MLAKLWAEWLLNDTFHICPSITLSVHLVHLPECNWGFGAIYYHFQWNTIDLVFVENFFWPIHFKEKKNLQSVYNGETEGEI